MPVIFISRGTMSGVSLVLHHLCQRTVIRCISREDLERKVNEYGQIAKKILKKLPNAITNYDEFSNLRWPFLVLMRKALLEEIGNGNVIYNGYSGHLLLPALRHFVRVRIHAPISLRIPMTMKRLSCDEKEARAYISKADEQRAKWARFVYAKDIRNPLLYDLCLNLEHVTPKAASDILEGLLGEEDFQETEESLAEVERLRLASDIEKELIVDPRTEGLEISATVADKEVRLVGPYLDEKKLKVVLQIARSVPGVEEVSYVPGYREKVMD